MGFSTIASTVQLAGNALSSFQSYQSQKESSKQLNALANTQEIEGQQRSQAMIDIAMGNATRATRNAQSELARAQLDAASSNLISSGSVAVRERDLATRLQDDINNQTTAELQQANLVRNQSVLDAYNTRVQAAQAKADANTTLFKGIGTAFSDTNAVLNTLSTSSPIQ